MNVALTRAKRKLVVIGDSSTIASKNKFYNAFLDFVNEIAFIEVYLNFCVEFIL